MSEWNDSYFHQAMGCGETRDCYDCYKKGMLEGCPLQKRGGDLTQPLKQESKRRLAFYKIDEFCGEDVLYITQSDIYSISTDGSDERFVGYCFDDTSSVWPCRLLYVLDFNGTQIETNINAYASKIFDTKWATHVAIWEEQ